MKDRSDKSLHIYVSTILRISWLRFIYYKCTCMEVRFLCMYEVNSPVMSPSFYALL